MDDREETTLRVESESTSVPARRRHRGVNRGQKHDRLFEILPQPCFRLDVDGTIVDASHAGLRELVIERAELLGRQLVEFVQSDDRSTTLNHLKQSGGNPGRPAQWRLGFVSGSGARLIVNVTAISTTDDAGVGTTFLIADKPPPWATAAAGPELRRVTEQLVQAEEQERRHIAEGLHDQVGSGLAIALLRLGELSSELPAEPARRIQEVRDQLKGIVEEVRSLTFHLSNPVLHKFGLVAALADLCDAMNRGKDLQIKFDADAELPPLADTSRIVLYQVLRELVLNVVKHASATSATLHIRLEGDQVVAEVEDNGKGLEECGPETRSMATGGFGLLRAQERLEGIGGCLTIHECKERGSRIEVRILCQEASPRRLEAGYE